MSIHICILLAFPCFTYCYPLQCAQNVTDIVQWIPFSGNSVILHKLAYFNFLTVEIDVDDSVNTIEQEVIAEVSKKRKTRLSGNKTKKKPKTGGPSDVDKNACMLLNEKCHDVVYSLTSQVGPVHMPLFTIQVTVNGQVWSTHTFTSTYCIMYACVCVYVCVRITGM